MPLITRKFFGIPIHSRRLLSSYRQKILWDSNTLTSPIRPPIQPKQGMIALATLLIKSNSPQCVHKLTRSYHGNCCRAAANAKNGKRANFQGHPAYSERKKISLALADCFGILLVLFLIKNNFIKKHARRHTFPVSCLPQRAGLTLCLFRFKP